MTMEILIIALASIGIACGLISAYCFGRADGIKWTMEKLK
jgi:hypothetical protein